MSTIIKNIKSRVVRAINHIAWQMQYKMLIVAPRKNNFSLDTEWYKKKKILMMVPHADDELISSYSVLCNADDITVYYCGYTGSNQTEENRITRRTEVLMLCSELNVKVIEGEGKCNNLKEVIEHGGYDAILLPSIVDWHEEHRKISYMVRKACTHLGIMPVIYAYSVTVPNESERKVLCFPMGKELLKEKYDLFKRFYISQRFMPIVRLKTNERINGYHARTYAAETFLRYEFDEWDRMVAGVGLLEESKVKEVSRDLKKNLNNLIATRKLSSKFYNWIEKGGEG